jgi:transcriptional regulator with XRE-family HTH domain
MDTTTIGTRIRSRRRQLGLTLAIVAERAEVSVPYVANLEHGRGNPTVDRLRRIAEALETSLAELVGEEVAGGLDGSLAGLPPEVAVFSRTERFASEVEELAQRRNERPEDVRQQLLSAIAAAPRRSRDERLTDIDLNRLLDTFVTILRQPQ